MPLKIIRNDITKMNVDAIVNAANSTLLGGGGVDGCIHAAAGKQLLEEGKTLGGCKTGEAKITKGYKLPCKYVIHTVGPIWQGGKKGEEQLLFSCYKNSLKLAVDYKCESVAFPLISSGVYGYPKDAALKVAVNAITDFLFDNELIVYIVIFDKNSYKISSKLFSDIQEYIDDVYAREKHLQFSRRSQAEFSPVLNAPFCKNISLKEAIGNMDEGFSRTLIAIIDKKGMTDVECYKRANIDRKLFSKIKNNPDYKPSKPTAVAFAIALKLDLEETNAFIATAGFVLSDSSKFDIIIKYFISKKIYDVFQINEALFAFDQTLLGQY